MIARKRDGQELETYDAQAGIIRFLYENCFGHVLLKVLIRPWVSRLCGRFMDSRFSKPFIKSFVESNHIDLDQYKKQSFDSYNDCFCRQIKPEFRPVDMEQTHLISPCDAKLTLHGIGSDACFSIKGHSYTLEELLCDSKLSRNFDGGTLAIFRLSVDDYHRYIYFDSGVVQNEILIPGVFHTVNPFAASKRAIYKENTRSYRAIKTDNFGQVLQMEVGALMVGRIVNEPILEGTRVDRGQEKGHFEFGGSTVILVFQKNAVNFDDDILENSALDIETVVKMGEKIGSVFIK